MSWSVSGIGKSDKLAPKLTAKTRNNLPAVEFAGPSRSYPIPDAAHAANAKARATQQVKAGNLAPSTAASIKAKANAKLDHYKPKRNHPLS